MKFTYFPNYAARNSHPVINAFVNGCRRLGFVAVANDMTADAAVIWSQLWAGKMVGNRVIWNHFRNSGRPVIVLEVGLLKRNTTWKVGVNGTGHGCYNLTVTHSHRAAELGLDLVPWRTPGSEILIAVQRSDSEQWTGQPDMQSWLQQMVRTVRSVSDRSIAIRLHPRQTRVDIPKGCTVNIAKPVTGTYDDFDFARALQNAWAVINHNSAPGSQSIMQGVPAFVHTSSLAWPVTAGEVLEIENPRRPDRQQWIETVSHSEWTVAEISTGQPLHRLLPLINT